MFKDYYKILGVSPSASDVEIKQAYREMSIKWHPDRNPDVDVTEKMQDINEAYAILKDVTKRIRYNQEYVRFCGTFQYDEESEDFIRTDEEDYSQTNWSYYYDVQDEELKEDIRNAQKYARELVEEFLKNLKETSKMAAKGAATNAFNYAVGGVLAGIFLAIVGSLIRACN